MMATFGAARMAPLVSRLSVAGSVTPTTPTCRPAMSRAAASSVRQQTRLFSHSRAPLSHPRRSVLEVERKFAPTATSIRQLDQNTGEPPFESVVHNGVTCFEDTYYDTPDNTLSRAGVWIRRREKLERRARPLAGHDRASPHAVSWEAKVRVGGDFINSAFREVTDAHEISALLGALVPGSELDVDHGPRGGRVRTMARFVTDRTGYLVDGKFTVVIDVTDFGHTVGEVELERNAAGALHEGEGNGEGRAPAIAAMDEEIDGFMRRFFWAFPTGKPVGKLTAYFDRRTASGRLLHEQD